MLCPFLFSVLFRFLFWCHAQLGTPYAGLDVLGPGQDVLSHGQDAHRRRVLAQALRHLPTCTCGRCLSRAPLLHQGHPGPQLKHLRARRGEAQQAEGVVVRQRKVPQLQVRLRPPAVGLRIARVEEQHLRSGLTVFWFLAPVVNYVTGTVAGLIRNAMIMCADHLRLSATP